jgi:hypothetical protein
MFPGFVSCEFFVDLFFHLFSNLMIFRQWGCMNTREESKNPLLRLFSPLLKVKNGYNWILPSQQIFFLLKGNIIFLSALNG